MYFGLKLSSFSPCRPGFCCLLALSHKAETRPQPCGRIGSVEGARTSMGIFDDPQQARDTGNRLVDTVEDKSELISFIYASRLAISDGGRKSRQDFKTRGEQCETPGPVMCSWIQSGVASEDAPGGLRVGGAVFDVGWPQAESSPPNTSIRHVVRLASF